METEEWGWSLVQITWERKTRGLYTCGLCRIPSPSSLGYLYFDPNIIFLIYIYYYVNLIICDLRDDCRKRIKCDFHSAFLVQNSLSKVVNNSFLIKYSYILNYCQGSVSIDEGSAILSGLVGGIKIPRLLYWLNSNSFTNIFNLPNAFE